MLANVYVVRRAGHAAQRHSVAVPVPNNLLDARGRNRIGNLGVSDDYKFSGLKLRNQ